MDRRVLQMFRLGCQVLKAPLRLKFCGWSREQANEQLCDSLAMTRCVAAQPIGQSLGLLNRDRIVHEPQRLRGDRRWPSKVAIGIHLGLVKGCQHV